jgi:hypothetical protein
LPTFLTPGKETPAAQFNLNIQLEHYCQAATKRSSFARSMKDHYCGTFSLRIILALFCVTLTFVHAQGLDSYSSYGYTGVINNFREPQEVITRRIFEGTWNSVRSGANTSGSLTVNVTPDGHIYGTLINGEESQNFEGRVSQRGSFNLPLTGGGRIRGKVRDMIASGRISGPRPIKWEANLAHVERVIVAPVSPFYALQYYYNVSYPVVR